MRSLMGGHPLDRMVFIQGQSNAVGLGGTAELSTAPLSADPTLAILEAADFSRVYIYVPGPNNYQKLRINTNNDAYSANMFGPEFGIAVRWMQETVKGNLYIFKYAIGGQAIASFQEGTSYWTNLAARYAAGNTWLANNNIHPVKMGWLWVQGESDYTQTQSYYETQLNTYISSLTTLGLLQSNSRRVLAQMPTSSTMYSAAITAAKTANAAANTTTTALITMPNYLLGDSLHENARGQLQIGYDAFASIFSRPSKVA